MTSPAGTLMLPASGSAGANNFYRFQFGYGNYRISSMVDSFRYFSLSVIGLSSVVPVRTSRSACSTSSPFFSRMVWRCSEGGGRTSRGGGGGVMSTCTDTSLFSSISSAAISTSLTLRRNIRRMCVLKQKHQSGRLEVSPPRTCDQLFAL